MCGTGGNRGDAGHVGVRLSAGARQRSRFEQCHQPQLVRAQAVVVAQAWLAKAVQAPVGVRFDDRGVDVALPAHGGSVAQQGGGGLDRLPRLDLGFGLRLRGTELAQLAEGVDAAAPGSERLGRERRAGHVADVVVHVARPDPAHVVVGDVLEQLLTGEVLTFGDDAGDSAIAEHDVVWLARLADEPEVERRGRDVDVFVEQCRQAVRVVGVLGIADPDQRVVEQPDGRGDDTFEREVAAPHVGVDPLAEDRQRMAEVDQRLELGLLSGALPFGVVAVLLAALGVAAGRLDVTVGVDAEPHVRPRRRDHEPAQALDRLAIPQRRALDVEVDEAAPAPPAAVAGPVSST